MKPSALHPKDDMELETFDPGIGATEELSLRVSVAALVKVLFEHPEHKMWMLALERRVTVHEMGEVEIKSQPFGGALRIHDWEALQNLIGDFHFDSEQSRAEQDFRIFIRHSAWRAVREFCIEHLTQPDNLLLEADPTRELAEEFKEVLDLDLKPEQYSCQRMGTVVENEPSPTENLGARGYPTVRIYQIFEARLLDTSFSRSILKNSDSHSDQHLSQLAQKNAQHDVPGWGNAVLTLPFTDLHSFYITLSPELLNTPIAFRGHRLDETVAAILEDITVAKYERRSWKSNF